MSTTTNESTIPGVDDYAASLAAALADLRAEFEARTAQLTALLDTRQATSDKDA